MIASLLGLLGWCFFLLPETLKRFFGGLLGCILFVTGYRRRVIVSNMERAFGEIPSGLVFRNCLHLGRLFLEMLYLFGGRLLRRSVDQFGSIEGREHLEYALSRGKGAIFVASHIGNWEMMAGTCPVYFKHDITFVTKLLKPAWIHRAVEQARRACGVIPTYEPRTLRDVLSTLKNNGAVGMILDQYAGPPIGIRVPFFGTPVGTNSAVATLVKRTGAAILPGVGYRRPDGSIHVEVRPAIVCTDAELEDPLFVGKFTAKLTEQIQRDILRYPDQWLWSHRRFKGELGPLAPDEWQSKRRKF